LSSQRADWNDKRWKQNIVDPIQQHHKEWLAYLETPAASETAENVAPTDAQGAAKRKSPGRRKAGLETVQKEAALAAEWEQARDAGVCKAVFARGKNLTVRDLDRLLDRVAKRNRLPNNSFRKSRELFGEKNF
jgi:hypothetical protein